MPVQDYLLDTSYDLSIDGGDFVIGESTSQHQQILLLSEKGEIRQYPRTGIGLNSFLNDESGSDLYAEIQKQFEADGMIIKTLSITEDGQVKVDAQY